ncbi:DUF1467 family protein [Mesorhizobium sp. RP14(2022)]|uniref:DUF1467 family protein n=1 Tax=Mesorhizobium liriopis TaxID=2953882 RepID=A0ABT1C7H4_9HYPH|nr:DUF1467 family protein [Mesorhizobium liriopis]MCO6050722.1 DUF1467 family protein [Mesorhizobium liriopis]
MNCISFSALTFIVWWLTLFAVLPFSLRTQDDENEVILGTTSSAPNGSHMRRAMLRTTIVTVILMGSAYLLVNRLGLGIDSIPSFVPDFDHH